MPLTSLELTIEQTLPGWLTRAERQAASLLQSQGRPQMAAALRAEFSRRPELGTLARYLRLHLHPGGAAPVALGPPATPHGTLDGCGAVVGRVPLQPQIDWLREPQEEGIYWSLMAGEILIVHRHDPVERASRLVAIGADEPWNGGNLVHPPLWFMKAESPWTHGATDGERVATLQRFGRGSYTLRLVDAGSGETLWEDPKVGERLGGHSAYLKLLMADGVVVVYQPDAGEAIAWNADSGDILWRQTVTSDAGYPHVLVAGPYLCLLPNGSLSAFDLRSGELRRREARLGLRALHCWGDGPDLFLWQSQGRLMRYELESGQCQTISHALVGDDGARGAPKSLAYQRGVAYLEHNGNLVAMPVGAPPGLVLWQRPAPSQERRTWLNIVGDTLLRTDTETLSAYRLADGEPLWENLKLSHPPQFCWGHPRGVLLSGDKGSLGLLREQTGAHRLLGATL